MTPRPLLAALALSATAAPAQMSPPVSGATPVALRPALPPALPYADVADLVLAAPVIADATIRSTVQLKGADAVGVRPGFVRFYMEADVAALIRGAGGLPPRVGWLYDAAFDARGRMPRFKKARVLLFARATATPGQLQLVAPDAQLGWAPDLDTRVRSIAREVLAPAAPPRVTGVGQAFHVAGALPGEGETQVFLQTADSRPVSLSVLRRPGERPRWAVALSEIVDDAAAPPPRDTLLWYRLACVLPPRLPGASIAGLAADDAIRAAEDYAFVLAQLGACGRTRS
ncbi:hypothetical protein [Sphingomonas sp.]|uniref:hypothetical protein n=1 Tax=Sphingomonas sp. TaxID=28214 RepID=UPI003CC54B38